MAKPVRALYHKAERVRPDPKKDRKTPMMKRKEFILGAAVGLTFAAAATGYIVTASGWNAAFSVLGVLGLIAALLFTQIDASKRVYKDSEPTPA